MDIDSSISICYKKTRFIEKESRISGKAPVILSANITTTNEHINLVKEATRSLLKK